MMKRIFSALLICLFLFSMAACGEKKNAKGEEYGTIDWSTIQLAEKLPIPESTAGKIISESNSCVIVDMEDVAKEDFEKYANQCKESGFTVDYYKSEKIFSGYNDDGYHLYVSYKDNNIMHIVIDAPQENEPQTGDETTDNDNKQQDNTPTTTEGVSADFKALMDSYEEFFDSYVAFMKKYKASTDQVSMMSDLADYMGKYSDMMAKLDAIDSKSLSDADAAYYAEVSARVMKKLAEVA